LQSAVVSASHRPPSLAEGNPLNCGTYTNCINPTACDRISYI